MRHGRLSAQSEAQRAPVLDRLARLNRCAPCHDHDRAERTLTTEGGPRRATDRAGFYLMMSVLTDRAPLETHRPRELNVGDPFVTVECDGAPARLESDGGPAAWACADERVPVARYDLARALAAGQPHAAAVCRSRRYLFEHMDDAARLAFAPAFAACAVQR